MMAILCCGAKYSVNVKEHAAYATSLNGDNSKIDKHGNDNRKDMRFFLGVYFHICGSIKFIVKGFLHINGIPLLHHHNADTVHRILRALHALQHRFFDSRNRDQNR